MPLDRHAARLLAMRAAAAGAEPSAEPSVEARRGALVDLARFAADPPPDDVLRLDLTTPVGRPLRRYTPPDAGDAALLYLHGGGWVAGDLETHAGVCGALAAASGCSVFALDYRQPPEHPFPAAVIDAVEALAWLRDEAATHGLSRSRVGIAGDSAGANVAAAACLEARADGASGPALQLLICPILDPLGESGSRREFREGYFIEAARLAQDLGDYLARAAADDPRAAPLRAADLVGLPSTWIHAAEYDPFRDEALAYAERLRGAGVAVHTTVHPGMIHYFYALSRAIPAARAILAEIGREAGAALRACG
jgi:acetyl esterase